MKIKYVRIHTMIKNKTTIERQMMKFDILEWKV